MKKSKLVFIPVPAFGHLTPFVQFAKHLLDRNERLSITVLIIPPLDNETNLDSSISSLSASDSRIKYTKIPPTNNLSQPSSSSPMAFEKLAALFIESQKPQIEQAVIEFVSDDSTNLLGFVLDMFCCCMIDIANKFNVPSYIFFTTNTSFLGFLLHLTLRDKHGELNFNPPDPDVDIPSYHNHVSANVLPLAAYGKNGGGYETFLDLGTRYQESKGIIVNSFIELETYAVKSMVTQQINVYQVGPLLDHKINHSYTSAESIKIKNWLDKQPSKSVIFICFGSMGSFKQPQIEQIAMALELSDDYRFLWSIRKPPLEDMIGTPTEYTTYENVLPYGFLERVKDRGMVCGWAPQVEVLAHEAIRGFVSHCGWNLILESLWYGVPIATWPLNAEQQMNAFLMVKELGVSVELSLTYKSSGSELVMVDQIKRAIDCCLMDDTNSVRERVKKISEESRNVLIKDGSSFVTLGELVEDMFET